MDSTVVKTQEVVGAWTGWDTLPPNCSGPVVEDEWRHDYLLRLETGEIFQLKASAPQPPLTLASERQHLSCTRAGGLQCRGPVRSTQNRVRELRIACAMYVCMSQRTTPPRPQPRLTSSPLLLRSQKPPPPKKLPNGRTKRVITSRAGAAQTAARTHSHTHAHAHTLAHTHAHTCTANLP